MPKKTKNQAEETQEDEIRSVTCEDFDIKRLYFTARENDKSASQLMCFPRYLYDPKMKCTPDNFEKHGSSPLVVTGPIHMVRGGIPRHNSQYHGNDPNSNSRAYFYVPLNEADENSVALFDMIRKIDEYLEEEINEKKNKNGIFCFLSKSGARKPIPGITYKSIIGESKAAGDSFDDDDEDDDKKKKKKYEPYKRVKVKFSTLFDQDLGPNDNRKITTQIYLDDNTEPEDTTCLTDIEKHLVWNSKCRFALMFNKVWVQKNGEKLCSVGIKCVQVGVTEKPEMRQNTSAQLTKSLFSSGGSKSNTKKAMKEEEESEEENGEEDEQVSENEDEESEKEDEDDQEDEQEDDQEDEDEDASEPESEEEEEKPKIKSKGKKAKVAGKKKTSSTSSKGKKKSKR